MGSVEYVAVLEGGVAAAGGAKFTGAVIPLAVPLVDRLKYLRSICGEIFGSDPEGTASGPAGPLATVESTGVADGVAGGVSLASVFVAAGGVAKAGGGGAGKSGGGRGIRTRLVAGCGGGRKRNATGPTAGK